MRPGWTSIFVIVLMIDGLQLLMLGLIGERFARVLDEVPPRPRYIFGRMSLEFVSASPKDVLVLGLRQPPKQPL